MSILVFTASRKKAELVKTGEPPAVTLSQAKELAIANDTGKPIVAGVQGEVQVDS